MTKYHTFDIVRATFKPQRTDDLKPGVADWIGWNGLWMAKGIADPDGAYAGQMGFSIDTKTMLDQELYPPWSWMPECDLEIHEDVVVLENT